MKSKNRYLLLNILTPVGAILFASLIGSLVILAIGKNPLAVYFTMFRFSLARIDSIASILFMATPLLFAGLAVAVSFKIGLFNIGAEGQYLMGALFAAVAGYGLNLPWFVHIPIVVAAGMLGGMLWALLPIVLKLKRGVHEVISTIMLNHIALALIHFLLTVYLKADTHTGGEFGSILVRTPLVADSAQIPTIHGVLNPILRLFGTEIPAHSDLNWFFVFGLLLCIAGYYVFEKTTLGYEIRVVGENRDTAQAAGINTQAVYFKTFMLSGAIAGLIGLSHMLTYYGYFDVDFPKGFGFTGIAVALVGKNNPLGVILAALLWAFLQRGAQGIQILEGVPMDTVVILQGVMILSIVIASEVVGRYIIKQQKKEAELND